MNDTLINAGRILADLKLTTDQARTLADRAVGIAAASNDSIGAALRGDLLRALKDRTVSYPQVEQIAASVERVLASGLSLTEARRIVGAMWAGAIIMQTRDEP